MSEPVKKKRRQKKPAWMVKFDKSYKLIQRFRDKRERLRKDLERIQKECRHPIARIITKNGKATGLAQCDLCEKVIDD